MKTRRRSRKVSKKQCPCNCESTIKSPEIRTNNRKKPRNSLKVNEKSIKIQKTTRKTNKKADINVNSVKQINDTPQVLKTNQTKIATKEPFVILKRLNIKSPTMKLRGNRQKNYCEPPSPDESTSQKSMEKSMEKPTEKIPIYKQQIEEDTKKSKKKNKKGDLYEFDSDSEDTKHKRRNQHKLNDSSHDEYNKTIENILRNVALKIRERKHSPGKKTETNTSNNTNLNNKNNKNDGKSTIRVTRRKLNEEKAFNETRIVEHKNDNQIDKLKLNEEQAPKEGIVEKLPSKPLPHCSQHDEESTEFNRNSPVSSSKLAPNDLDKTFGFLDDNEDIAEVSMDDQANKTPKINIISNVKLKPHQQLVFARNPETPIVQPNANSTMIYNVLTPWRFNEINIRRNPHLIQVKNSALPCITQEPVLEYSIIEKLASTPHHNGDDHSFNDKEQKQSVIQTPILRRSPRKYVTPTIQKTLDDYYGNSENKENQRVITRYSLFDADELSPIKSVEDKRSPLAAINSIKRQILNDFNDNTKENTPIIPINLNKIDHNDVKTYFGFESDDSSKIDNDKANKDDRPYRLSINTNDRKYEVKKKRVRIEDDKEEEEKEVENPPNQVISDDDQDDSKSDAESIGGGLFEEIHVDKEKKENKSLKKRKIKWMLTDDDDYKPRKRRKDVRTKKEEEAAERWAEQFNSMCKEVEEFPLEIE